MLVKKLWSQINTDSIATILFGIKNNYIPEENDNS